MVKNLTAKQLDLDEINLIDIRNKQSFLTFHLAKSININDEKEILEFIKENNAKKNCLACFSSIKAKQMAEKISNYLNDDIYFLDENLLFLKELNFDFVEANLEFFDKIKNTKNDILQKYLSHKKAWIVAFSGGKDSTCVLQLLYEIIISIPREELNPTYAIVSNTLVEAPNVDNYLKNLINHIKIDAKKRGLPFKILEVSPKLEERFFTNLIGKGYPSPTRTFRWCTDRLKIRPTQKIVENIVKKHGSAILMLGVRESESINRKKSIEKRELNEEGFNKHDFYPNTLIYSPIKKWNLDDVWGYLNSFNPPAWGKSHNDLFSLYAKASNDECSFIIDNSQKSCGGSRFGCWVCTLVNEDKSMQGFIKSGEENFKFLNDFRNFIKFAREDKSMRADFQKNGNYRPGPFTSEARKQILRKLLEAEKKFKASGGKNLISDEELKLIAKYWNKEFDSSQSCLKIAKEFGRMQNIEVAQNLIIHEEIIDEFRGDKELLKAVLKDLINQQNNANEDFYAIIKKHIDDKTMKFNESF